MRKVLTISLILLLIAPGFAQERPAAYRAYTEKYPDEPALNHRDSLYMMNIPEKTMPDHLRSSTLPPLVDNSTLPYLRPVFMQEGPSCGQAAMIGYNFTYEIDYLRDQPAVFLQTQYPTHFTWNFQNGGNGWYGVSYFHSIEILRLCGCMNAYDYGNYYDDGRRWINGYDNYYNGMYNRVRGVYSIHTGTAEGLLTLKHWLYDHLGEGDYGGVASYYANVPWNAQILNDTTPEGGKHVMFAWYPVASHAMTIVGYNDSIRWDYNFDGQYTNNIDLNGDGVLDPRDWEIGAVKFVNSHGLDAQDSGFCYMMYKCLAETFEEGGVWNQAVHILDVNENYQPLMTYKITLKHNFREKVKVLAGVSQDTSETAPAWLMDFPIIDYQGDNHYLQGQDTAGYLQYLEFGLDVTPLLSYLQPGEPTKFFFIVDENDPFNEGEGEITSFSVMDYTSGELEIISEETPVILGNNSRTLASVIHFPDFEIVEITSESLPPFAVGQPYSYQLEAEGGTPPYSWGPLYNYRVEQSLDTFPAINENQVLYTATTDTIMPVPLGFSFPFYGTLYDTVYMHINGNLQFDNAQLPWPYMQEPDLQFRSNRIIAPMMHYSFTITPADGDGGWAEINDTTATFRWKLSQSSNPGMTDLNFAVRLRQNGNIEFFFGPSTIEDISWLGGISAGNNKDFINSPYTGTDLVPAGKKILFYYPELLMQLDLSDNGLLTGQFDTDDFIYDFSFHVTDQSGISATKTLQLTSGPYLFFTVHPGDQVEYGDTVGLDLEIRNNSGDTLWNTSLELMTSDPFIEMPDPECVPGTLLPGQVITIPDAFYFIVSIDIPDQRNLLFNVNLTTLEKVWYKELTFVANAPNLKIKKFFIDNEEERLDPGETAPIIITFQNTGHAAIDGVSAELSTQDPEVQVLDNPVQLFGMIGKGASVSRSYLLQADESTPEGFPAHFVLSSESLPGLQRLDSIGLMIGKKPVFVIDMDPNHHSGPVIFSQLNELNVLADYEYGIPSGIDKYQSLFICLGFHYSNHVLTLGEGQQLADYLDNGGKIYMEGRKTWKEDPGTPVQPKFFLSWAGTATIFDTLTGIDGTFTQGLKLLNEATNPFSFYHIEPVPPAFAILQDNDNLKPCAIAYDAGNYKTIGTLFEFGTLTGLPTSATRELMLKYLDFFDIYVNPIGMDESQEETGCWQVYPNPVNAQLTIAPSLTPSPNWGRDGVGAVGSKQVAFTIIITDLFGLKLKEFDKISSFPFFLDISDLNDGLYILRIIDEEGQTSSVKFMKISN